MASSILHIKDSYYFEVPKALLPSHRDSKEDFPEVWVRLDPDYQLWEGERLHGELKKIAKDTPDWESLKHDYLAWKDADHANFGKPLDVYIDELIAGAAKEKDHAEATWYTSAASQTGWPQKWAAAKSAAEDVNAYVADTSHQWSEEKLAGYNKQLSGKILIPQPFGKLRNFYEGESGFLISKFMVLMLGVTIVLALLFSWLAKRIQPGHAPRGKVWNLLEVFLLFLRDEVARPAIGKHDADRFVPLLWTIFFFILGCNLLGLVPWAGTPTAAFGVTLGLALVTFGFVVVSGSQRFGLVGFWKNQVPSMDLPFPMGFIIKPMLFAIEVIGLFIKHAVLGIRLLANMVAGHLVLLGIMGLAFSLEGAMNPYWTVTAVISVTAAVLFSLLELFVAFLQAYVFTFLSALFIGAAVHHH